MQQRVRITKENERTTGKIIGVKGKYMLVRTDAGNRVLVKTNKIDVL